MEVCLGPAANKAQFFWPDILKGADFDLTADNVLASHDTAVFARLQFILYD